MQEGICCNGFLSDMQVFVGKLGSPKVGTFCWQWRVQVNSLYLNVPRSYHSDSLWWSPFPVRFLPLRCVIEERHLYHDIDVCSSISTLSLWLLQCLTLSFNPSCAKSGRTKNRICQEMNIGLHLPGFPHPQLSDALQWVQNGGKSAVSWYHDNSVDRQN